MPNNKHGAIVADPRSLIRHRYSLIPRRTFPVRKIQFPVPAPREFPDSTLKVRVFFRFDHRFVRQIQRNSLFFPCKQGNPLGAGFAADWSLRQSILLIFLNKIDFLKYATFPRLTNQLLVYPVPRARSLEHTCGLCGGFAPRALEPVQFALGCNWLPIRVRAA